VRAFIDYDATTRDGLEVVAEKLRASLQREQADGVTIVITGKSLAGGYKDVGTAFVDYERRVS